MDEVKTMNDVYKAHRERNEALAYARDMESKIVTALVNLGATHLFTVNWRRLNSEVEYEERNRVTTSRKI